MIKCKCLFMWLGKCVSICTYENSIVSWSTDNIFNFFKITLFYFIQCIKCTVNALYNVIYNSVYLSINKQQLEITISGGGGGCGEGDGYMCIYVKKDIHLKKYAIFGCPILSNHQEKKNYFIDKKSLICVLWIFIRMTELIEKYIMTNFVL